MATLRGLRIDPALALREESIGVRLSSLQDGILCSNAVK
jgi:hypothetical protein